MENTARVINVEEYREVKELTTLTRDFGTWLKSKDAQDAFFLWMEKQEKQVTLEGCGALCASCARKDLTTCQCYAGHIQSTNYPVTKCRDYREEGAPAVSED